MDNQVLSVSEFNEQVNLLLGQHFPEVVVEGEISELRTAKNDTLLYITLKDEKAELKIFAFSSKIINWKQLEEGMSVQVFGRPEIYSPRGRLNFHAHDIIPVGEGALRIAFEKLKKKLEIEGFFAPERKRPLPDFPEKIGLLTAPKSRAYSDFIKVLGERIGGLEILFYPVQVQGVEAPKQIVKALNWFTTKATEVDLLVVTRGGGSLEDLAAFNTEEVVRAVYRSPVPVVAAVGHEADISLIDLVADLRASTPSNAAELVVPHREELGRVVNNYFRHLTSGLRIKVNLVSGRIDQSINAIERYFQKQRLIVSTLERRVATIGLTLTRLAADSLARLNLYWQTIDGRVGYKLNLVLGKIEQDRRLVESLNPEAILARGYSVTRAADGRILKDVSQTEVGDRIFTRLSRGKIDSTIERLGESND